MRRSRQHQQDQLQLLRDAVNDLDHRGKLAEVGVSAQMHTDLAHKVTRLRETLAQIQSALTVVQTARCSGNQRAA